MRAARSMSTTPSNAASHEDPESNAGADDSDLPPFEVDATEERDTAPEAPDSTAAALLQKIFELEKDNADLRSRLEEAHQVASHNEQVKEELQSDNDALRMRLASAEDIIERLPASMRDPPSVQPNDDTPCAAAPAHHGEQRQSPEVPALLNDPTHHTKKMAKFKGASTARKFFNAIPEEGRDAFFEAAKVCCRCCALGYMCVTPAQKALPSPAETPSCVLPKRPLKVAAERNKITSSMCLTCLFMFCFTTGVFGYSRRKNRSPGIHRRQHVLSGVRQGFCQCRRACHWACWRGRILRRRVLLVLCAQPGHRRHRVSRKGQDSEHAGVPERWH